MKITASEKKCKDMADICELAHKRTVRECNRLKIQHTIDVDFGMESSYTEDGQIIFNRNYDYICEVTGL